MNESINYKGVYRTAPATPGLLIIPLSIVKETTLPSYKHLQKCTGLSMDYKSCLRVLTLS